MSTIETDLVFELYRDRPRNGRGFETNDSGLSLINYFAIGMYEMAGKRHVMTWIEPQEHIPAADEIFARMAGRFKRNIAPLASGPLTPKSFLCMRNNGNAAQFPAILQQIFAKVDGNSRLQAKYGVKDFFKAAVWDHQNGISWGTLESIVYGIRNSMPC